MKELHRKLLMGYGFGLLIGLVYPVITLKYMSLLHFKVAVTIQAILGYFFMVYGFFKERIDSWWKGIKIQKHK